MEQRSKINNLTSNLEKIYQEESKKLLFHGWHHIVFVKNKAIVFGKFINADLFSLNQQHLFMI